MKKLMAMIGAVAMSFGLFADATPFAMSFEAQDDGVSEQTWTPGTGWTWTPAEAFTLTTGDREGLLPYTGTYDAETNPTGRRDGSFASLATNANWLDLSTGSDELTLRVTEGNMVLDQLVKFTGFEDSQTNLVGSTKIAIWMSEFEEEDESTTTNLYVTCGKVTAGGTEKVAIKIAGDAGYELNKWYHLTVVSLGDIYDGAKADARAGFKIYINGQMVAAVEGQGADALVYDDALMTAEAKSLMTDGSLFPAIDDSNATLTSVSFKGIGAIDDIIVDEEGPNFRTDIAATVEIPEGAIVTIVDKDGNPIVVTEGAFSLEPKKLPITVTWSADVEKGYVMDDVQKVITELTAGAEIKADGVNPQMAILMVQGSGDAELYATVADALVAVTNLEAAGEVEIIVSNIKEEGAIEPTLVPDFGTIGLGEGVSITITPADATWTADGDMTLETDIVEGATIVVEGGVLTYAGVVAGSIKADEFAAVDTKVATLTGDGTIVTMTDGLENDTIVTTDDNKTVVASDPDEEDFITYSAAQSAAKVAEIVGGDQYATLQAAIEAAQDGDVIKLLSNYTAADTESIIFNNDVTFDLNGKTLTLSNAQREGKKFAMGAEEQGGPDVTITNGVINFVTISGSGASGRGFNVFGGTLTVACTFTQTGDGSSQPVFDIYSTATVNIEPEAVIDALHGDAFRSKGDLNTACFVNINGGSITCPANGVFNTAKPLPLTVTLNGGEISYAGGDLIHSGSSYDAQFICNLDDTCGAKFDTDTAKSAGCGLKDLVAEGYEAVEGEDEWYTIAKIPSFDVTFTQNNEPIAGSTTNVLRGTALTADMIPAVEGGTWDVNPVGAIITSNTNFNYTVAVGPEWPEDWPADVPPAMKEAFKTWAEGKGTLDFNQKAVQDAFLMNTEVGAVPELKIESISVEGTTATIVVSATGKDLETGINGVLYIDAANDLTNWTTTEVETNADFTDGKATFTVNAAKFMKAGVGFKAPEAPVTE